jgi:hypothetical protein
MCSVQRSVGRCKKAKRLGEVKTVDRAYQRLELEVKVKLTGLHPGRSDACARALWMRR